MFENSKCQCMNVIVVLSPAIVSTNDAYAHTLCQQRTENRRLKAISMRSEHTQCVASSLPLSFSWWSCSYAGKEGEEHNAT